MKSQKIIYWASTGLLTAIMLFSAGMYIFNNIEVVKAFEALNFPPYIIYPLATAKILGLVAIWTKLSSTLIEWAYAGFFFNSLLAFSAHYMAEDGGSAPALVVMILVLVSYLFYKKLY